MATNIVDVRFAKIETQIDDLRKEFTDLRNEIHAAIADLRKDIRQVLVFVAGSWVTLLAAILLKH